MRLLSCLLVVGSLVTGSACVAQQPVGVAQSFATLAEQPATHTAFTFDRMAMQVAQGVLEMNGMPPERAAAALRGITVENFRYREPAFYTPEAMEGLIASYKAAGWKHLVNGRQTAANTAQPKQVVTDLWLHFTGADIDGVTVLARAERQMSVVELTCDLRPLDLVHLSGHFGIPKVDPGAVMVPAPGER
ncbi:hypothetical protein FTO74_04520 [Granulicella sp. WH15]|uniref:hypothetical protein n=1 Tax=Granulicella sp. WH15 TaxID=2602070 RepID=UPI0013673608|nr:hypothetical protein [Granulicella sp. WH15]QHN02716.1 hypothetical protein FTO74_04520 [Granulicella sp. WH15]